MQKIRWWVFLLAIPAQLLLDFIVLSAAALLDISIASGNGLGHPAPAFTLVIGTIFFVITVIVFIAAIVLAIVRLVNDKKAR